MLFLERGPLDLSIYVSFSINLESKSLRLNTLLSRSLKVKFEVVEDIQGIQGTPRQFRQDLTDLGIESGG